MGGRIMGIRYTVFLWRLTNTKMTIMLDVYVALATSELFHKYLVGFGWRGRVVLTRGFVYD